MTKPELIKKIVFITGAAYAETSIRDAVESYSSALITQNPLLAVRPVNIKEGQNYTLKRYRRVINDNIKQEAEVLNSGRISDQCRLKVQAERVRILEWVKLWLVNINDTQKKNLK